MVKVSWCPSRPGTESRSEVVPVRGPMLPAFPARRVSIAHAVPKWLPLLAGSPEAYCGDMQWPEDPTIDRQEETQSMAPNAHDVAAEAWRDERMGQHADPVARCRR